MVFIKYGDSFCVCQWTLLADQKNGTEQKLMFEHDLKGVTAENRTRHVDWAWVSGSERGDIFTEMLRRCSWEASFQRSPEYKCMYL